MRVVKMAEEISKNEGMVKSLQEMKKSSKERKFSQTIDFIVTLKELDMRKPENRIDDSFILPKGRGKGANIVIFSDSVKTDRAEVMTTEEINKLAGNKREAKKMANRADFLFADPKLMPVVARALGTMLGPRGKIPKILAGNIDTLIDAHKNATKIKVKESPTVQCVIGNDKMKEEDVVENIEALLKYLEGKLPGGRSNINKVMVKTTMGKPVILEAL